MSERSELDVAFVRAAHHALTEARSTVTPADFVAVADSHEPVPGTLWDLIRASSVAISPELLTAFGRAATRAHGEGRPLRARDVRSELDEPGLSQAGGDEIDQHMAEYMLVSSRVAASPLRDWDRADDLSWVLAEFLGRALLNRPGATDIDLVDQLVAAAERIVASNGDDSIPASLFAQACGRAASAVGLI